MIVERQLLEYVESRTLPGLLHVFETVHKGEVQHLTNHGVRQCETLVEIVGLEQIFGFVLYESLVLLSVRSLAKRFFAQRQATDGVGFAMLSTHTQLSKSALKKSWYWSLVRFSYCNNYVLMSGLVSVS